MMIANSVFEINVTVVCDEPWWRHQMEKFSALLATCAGNSPVPGEFTAQRPVTRSNDLFCDLHPNKRLSKEWRGWWFETASCPLWRHSNAIILHDIVFPALLQQVNATVLSLILDYGKMVFILRRNVGPCLFFVVFRNNHLTKTVCCTEYQRIF